MRYLPLLPAALLIVAGCGRPAPVDTPPPPPRPPWTDDLQAVADGNNRFALDLYAQLREEPGNVFFSPYSRGVAHYVGFSYLPGYGVPG